MKTFISIVFSLIINCTLAICQNCENNITKNYTFNDIKTILDKNKCNNCHYTDNKDVLWHYDTYNAMSKGYNNCNLPIITHGNVTTSFLIDKINGGPSGCGNAMPLGGKQLSDNDLLAIETWIQEGAPELCIPDFKEISQIFVDNNCVQCHNNNDNLHLNSYFSLNIKPTNSICDASIIVPYNAASSLLYTKIAPEVVQCGTMMSNINGNELDEKQVIAIRDWINAGALFGAKVLPVTLHKFDADVYGDEIRLFWETKAEVNTDNFVVQHSKDGIQFTDLQSVISKGTTGGVYSYSHKHFHVGYNYYRLRINDFDASYTFSQIRVVKIKNEENIFNIYPIPVASNNQIYVEWYPENSQEIVKMYILDILGKMQTYRYLHNGLNSITLDGLQDGIYYVSVADFYDQRILKKIVIYNSN